MSRRRRQRGSMMVELTLVMSLFFALILGIITLGYLIFTYNSLAFMAQQGTRRASVRGSSTATPATIATVKTFVLTQAVGLSAGAVNVNTTWLPDNKPGSSVKVIVSYAATPLSSTFLPLPIAMSSTSIVTISR